MGTVVAQNARASLSGSVSDAQTKEVLQYVNVAVLSTKDSSMINGVITNENGKFSITNMKLGKFIVRFSFIGYKDVFKNVELKGGNVNMGNIELSQSSEMLEGVEIVAERQMMEYKLDKRVINVDKNIVSAGGSASEVLENVPSVSVDEEGEVSLRGNSNVKVLIDGKPSELLGSDLASVLAQIPASTIENIEVITNPSAKYDPDGMSGIINIKLKEKGNMKLLCPEAVPDREVTGCYCGDLLSWVMSRATEGDAWLTVMGNINAVGVAVLCEASCIILTENAALDENALLRAQENGVVILQTEKNTYETAVLIYELLKS